MNKNNEKEVDKALEKIRNYPQGFKFKINYASLPTKAKENGMKYVLTKAEELGYIECISIGHSLDDLSGKSGRFCSEETYKRL